MEWLCKVKSLSLLTVRQFTRQTLQIITSKLKTLIGGKSENIIKGYKFNDEQATTQLNELKNKYPNNLIVVSGELTIDLPDKIAEYAKPDTMKTFNISINKLTFNNCLLDQAMAVLYGQYVISKRSAKRVGSIEISR